MRVETSTTKAGGGRTGRIRGRRTVRVTSWLAAMGIAATATAAVGQVWEVDNRAFTLTGGSQADAYYGATVASGDFNGDGYPDLAVGAPRFDHNGSVTDSGRMEIRLGGPNGLAPSILFGTSGSVAQMEYGKAIVFGDFNGDGKDELVVGAPGFDTGGEDQAGRIYVYEDGVGGSVQFDQNTGSIQDSAEPFDHFGAALAVGDFDNDTFDDLAIGVPGENLEGPPANLDAGVIQILYGSPTGLTDVGNQRFTQAALGGVQANARFGSVLVAGDFDDDDTYYDLAIGVPERDVAGISDAGQVVILRGTATGLLTTNSQVLDQSTFTLTNQTGDRFGAALAAGDFNRTPTCWNSFTCFTDLAIGLPGQNSPAGTPVEAGAVLIAYGSASGITSSGRQFLYQNDLDIGSSQEPNDNFGAVLVSGWYTARLLNGGKVGTADHLVIGAPNEDWVSDADAGIIHLAFGGPGGLLSGGTGQFRVVEPGMAASPRQADARFGSAIAIGDFDGNGHADLAIGVPEQDVAGEADAGLVQVMYGALFASGFEADSLTGWNATSL